MSRVVRVVLPSNRIAEFTLPNTRQFIDLERDVLKELPHGLTAEAIRAVASISIQSLFLRRFFTGLSQPVDSVMRDGVEDIEATKARGNCEPVTDADWDGVSKTRTAEYIRVMQDSEMGTVESADYRGILQWIHDRAIVQLFTPPEIPNAPKVVIRPVRA